MITWDDVEIVAPELSTVTTGLQDEILALVEDTLDAEAWTSAQRLRMGQIFYAAHMATCLATTTSGDAVWPVSSETVGGVSRDYVTGGITAALDDFNSTKYGQQYMALIRSLPSAMGYVP